MPDVELHDRARVTIRELGPSDQAGLAAGLDRLSASSRYRRFLVPVMVGGPHSFLCSGDG